jgi:magnesium chelatase subunit I
MTLPSGLPDTLGSLRSTPKYQTIRSVKQELRDNLIAKLKNHETLFPGIVGYEETVAPQVVNAVLSQHNFILLGLRGQAKTRLIRMLVSLLDDYIPYIAGCEIHDHPLAPICKPCRDLIAEKGDARRDHRRHDRRHRSD